jgi:hypothetical protein
MSAERKSRKLITEMICAFTTMLSASTTAANEENGNIATIAVTATILRVLCMGQCFSVSKDIHFFLLYRKYYYN